MALALVKQLEKAESVVKDLFLEATDDGIEALEAVLEACRESVIRRGEQGAQAEAPKARRGADAARASAAAARRARRRRRGRGDGRARRAQPRLRRRRRHERRLTALPLSRAYVARDGAPVIHEVDAAIFHAPVLRPLHALRLLRATRAASTASTSPSRSATASSRSADAIEPRVGVPRDAWFDARRSSTTPIFPAARRRAPRWSTAAASFSGARRAAACCTPSRWSEGEDYHVLKPMVSALFPVTFGGGALLCSEELTDGSLVCAGEGPTAYEMARDELAYYFGDGAAWPSSTRWPQPRRSAARCHRLSVRASPGTVARSCCCLANAREERRRARTIGQRPQDAHRVLPADGDARRKAVRIHSHALQLGQQLARTALVSHVRWVRLRGHARERRPAVVLLSQWNDLHNDNAH